MSKIFLPSCKVKAAFKSSSNQLRTYLEEKENVRTVGCYKAFYSKFSPEDTAVVVCNNCAAITDESSEASSVEFVWEIIDHDPDFIFPDYHGERMTVQDCWRAYDRRNVQDAIRSLLRKMNIEVVEIENNFENADFCGADLLEPCTSLEKKFAPKRYVLDGAQMYHPIPKEQEDAWLKDYCKRFTTDKVVCYCMACLDGIKRGGKNDIHLIQLLFPEIGEV